MTDSSQEILHGYFGAGGDVSIGDSFLGHDDAVAASVSDDGGGPGAVDSTCRSIIKWRSITHAEPYLVFRGLTGRVSILGSILKMLSGF